MSHSIATSQNCYTSSKSIPGQTVNKYLSISRLFWQVSFTVNRIDSAYSPYAAYSPYSEYTGYGWQ